MKHLVFLIAFLFTVPAFSQVTVISGSGIKPEAGSTKKTTNKKRVTKKKKRRVVRIKAGKSFTVQSLQNINSKLTPLGSSVFFKSIESVPGLPKGTLIRGEMSGTQVGKNKKAVLIELKEAIRGRRLYSVAGTIQSLPAKRGKHATILVGENFTAKTAKNTLRGKAAIYKSKHYRGKLIKDTSFAELLGGEVKVDFGRGKAKGFAFLLLEASKGKELKIFNDNLPLFLTHVGKIRVPEPVVSTGLTKIGDRNKNGVMDLRFSFPKAEFVKYLPAGSSMITVQGKLKDGKRFESKLRVKTIYR